MNSRRLFVWSLVSIGAAAIAITAFGLVTQRDARNDAEEFAASRQAFAPVSFEVLGVLDADLLESSGLAVSRTHEGVLWTHNDSGSGPILHAIRMDGTLIRRFRVLANAIDWEALDLGPCPPNSGLGGAGGGDCLYIGDLGDNGGRRPNYQLYVVPEPDPLSEDAAALVPRTLQYRYAEGPDNTEAMAVTPSGRITWVTKGSKGRMGIYHSEFEEWVEALDRQVLVLESVGVLPMPRDFPWWRTVTGAGYSRSGELLAVRSYSEISFFTVDENGTLREVGEACYLGQSEPQGEAVAFLDERTLLTTSEGARGGPPALYQMTCG